MKDTDLDLLMEKMPNLRQLRRIDANQLRRLFSRQKMTCTWCGGIVKKPSRTWCNGDCLSEFYQRCDPQAAKRFVEKRDSGRCQICGCDTFKTERIWRSTQVGPTAMYRRPCKDDEAATVMGFARGQWREVDHVIPVIEGGGLLPPSNLRLLCGACHRDECRELCGRRKQTPLQDGAS